MLNLSDVTGYYIEHKFIDEMKVLVLDAFGIMEEFQLNFYEDKYIEVINKYEAISDDDIYTIFISYLVSDINEIISAHGVTVDADGQPSLADLIEIAHGLLLLANLEDYSYVRYRVNTEQSPRNILLDLLERYTMLSRVRLMEIVGEVKETIIETLKGLSDGSVEEEGTIDLKHHKYTNYFIDYIGDTPCLMLTLKEKGFDLNLTLEELVNLLPFDLSESITKTSRTNLAQAALDVLGLLIYTRDDYTMPVFKFKRHSNLFTLDNDLVMRINNALFAMMSDFSTYLEARVKGEEANAN